jgi:phospholipid-binding lipoprotein MlaA
VLTSGIVTALALAAAPTEPQTAAAPPLQTGSVPHKLAAVLITDPYDAAEQVPAVTVNADSHQAVEPAQADVVVRARDTRGDPAAGVNAAVLDLTEGLDKALIGPVALAYEKKVPSPLRSGLRNFLNNLREPIVFANFLLQLKIGKAAETAARFALNTTIGVAGVMDMAKRKPFRLPLRRNSFANTLGFYGVGPGPFLMLPLIGPTTLRDLLGTVVDQVAVPIQPIRPSNSIAYTLPVGVLSALDYRVRIEPDLQRQRASGDPYAALRDDYLAKRKAEIHRLRGRPTAPLPKVDDSPYSTVPR